MLIIIYKTLNNFEDIKKFFGGFAETVFPCLLGVAFALFLYIPSKKLEDFLERKGNSFIRKNARVISVLALYLLIMAVVALALLYVIPVLYKSVEELIANIPRYTKTADNFLKSTGFLKGVNLTEVVNTGISRYLNFERMSEYIGLITSVTSSFTSILVSVAISIYLLIDRDDIVEYFNKIVRVFHSKWFKKDTKYLKKTLSLFCSYFLGQGIDALIVGAITTLGLFALGVSYPLLIGVIIAIGNFIPVFGCIVSTVVTCAIILVTRGLLQFVTLLLFLVTVHTFDAYFIQPKIAGKTTGIKPIAALVSVVIFGNLFGIAGMFLGVPITAAAKMVLDDYIEKKKPV